MKKNKVLVSLNQQSNSLEPLVYFALLTARCATFLFSLFLPLHEFSPPPPKLPPGGGGENSGRIRQLIKSLSLSTYLEHGKCCQNPSLLIRTRSFDSPSSVYSRSCFSATTKKLYYVKCAQHLFIAVLNLQQIKLIRPESGILPIHAIDLY